MQRDFAHQPRGCRESRCPNRPRASSHPRPRARREDTRLRRRGSLDAPGAEAGARILCISFPLCRGGLLAQLRGSPPSLGGDKARSEDGVSSQGWQRDGGEQKGEMSAPAPSADTQPRAEERLAGRMRATDFTHFVKGNSIPIKTRLISMEKGG